jgi:ABC-type transporter Mla maintaining outer membrane lipid asymmetry ATPase subunit MlaF
MTNTSQAVVEMTMVRKGYGALRPLRVQSLRVAQAERVAIAGIDAPGAEIMVNLVTGASLPEEGEIRVFGRRTADVADGDAWLASLDRFGIVSERAVMLEGATLAQNLALPFTLEIDPVSADTRARVTHLAAECDIAPEWLDQPAGELPPGVRVRAHLVRALALGPELLLMEHPTATLPEADGPAFGAVVRRVCAARALTTLMISMDAPFSAAAADRALALEPATGALKDQSRRRWFGF